MSDGEARHACGCVVHRADGAATIVAPCEQHRAVYSASFERMARMHMDAEIDDRLRRADRGVQLRPARARLGRNA